MQTFLPYPDILQSVRCLDYRRLGKQRVEAFQILKALNDPRYGWQNHPAVKMWRGYHEALTVYMNVAIMEWMRRGYKNTMEIKTEYAQQIPPWFGNPEFHASHRSNLLRKDFTFYSKYHWTESTDLEYVWPVQ